MQEIYIPMRQRSCKPALKAIFFALRESLSYLGVMASTSAFLLSLFILSGAIQ